MNIKDKITASAIHFTASFVIFSLLLIVLTSNWYPDPYFTASGGWQGLKIIILIDLVLGPLLTFIVFNKSKSIRELTLDLGLIILLQLSALAWGIVTIYYQRPVAIVFFDDRFFTVPDNALSAHYAKNPAYQDLLTHNTPFIFSKKPGNVNELKTMQDRMKKHDIAPHHQIENYQAFKPAFSNIKSLSLDITEIIEHNSDMKQSLEAILAKTKSSMQDNVYLRLESKYRNIVLVFNQSGDQLGFIKAPYKK